MPSLTESTVEDAALTWLGELGYAVGHGRHHAPQTGQREKALFQSDAKPQSLPRQRDIRRALIEADLVDTALRDSAFLQSEAKPQVLSAAKSNMVALPGQLFYRFENEHAAVAA
jgi:hypothetical protein